MNSGKFSVHFPRARFYAVFDLDSFWSVQYFFVCNQLLITFLWWHSVAFEDVDKKLKAERREIQKLKDAIQQRDKQTADEWIQRETDLMSQFSSQTLKEREEFEQQIRTAENNRAELLENVEKLTTERDAALEDAAVLQVYFESLWFSLILFYLLCVNLN